jgi:hypothetical protein
MVVVSLLLLLLRRRRLLLFHRWPVVDGPMCEHGRENGGSGSLVKSSLKEW